MAVNEKIRIKIKGYDHAVVDAAAAKIVDAAKRSGARVSGPIPLPTDKEIVQFSVLYTSTRIAVSSLNSELIRDLSTFSDLLPRPQRLFRVLSFPQALTS